MNLSSLSAGIDASQYALPPSPIIEVEGSSFTAQRQGSTETDSVWPMLDVRPRCCREDNKHENKRKSKGLPESPRSAGSGASEDGHETG